MKLYDEAFKAAALTVNAFRNGELEGYPADDGISLPWICQMALNAGAGDHLEIGTSWGASAIAVALAKRAAGLPGKVYCIDPFPAKREAKMRGRLKTATISATRRNFKAAEVDVTIIRASSDPFPTKLDAKHPQLFVSSYIDGSHRGDMPSKDLAACAKRTQHFIGVDNYEEAIQMSWMRFISSQPCKSGTSISRTSYSYHSAQNSILVVPFFRTEWSTFNGKAKEDPKKEGGAVPRSISGNKREGRRRPSIALEELAPRRPNDNLCPHCTAGG